MTTTYLISTTRHESGLGINWLVDKIEAELEPEQDLILDTSTFRPAWSF